MSIKTKYSTKRKYIRMSFNKYNIYNLASFYKVNRYFKKKRFKIRSYIYKSKLLAKQRLRRYYGNLRELQLKKLYRLAIWYRKKFNKKSLSVKKYLLMNLERRLDAALFRLCLTPSIFASRQLISHGHVLVNGKKVRTPSYMLNVNDLIQINKKSFHLIKKFNLLKKKSIKRRLIKQFGLMIVPKYFIVNFKILSAIFIKIPRVREIPYPFKVKSHLISRYYKRMRY